MTKKLKISSTAEFDVTMMFDIPLNHEMKRPGFSGGGFI